VLKLGVNVDHVATLREARYRGLAHGEPNLVDAIRICEHAGAKGITLHLREDRRHIQDRDVWNARETVSTRLNLEMGNAPEIVEIALKLKPEIVCLVPERRQEVTTEGGFDVAGLFITPDPVQVAAAAKSGAQFIELHTGAFAESFRVKNWNGELQRLKAAAEQAHALGLNVNAGHGLNVANVAELKQVPHLVELNIGHSIVSRAIFVGLATAVREMLEAMSGYNR